MKYIDIVALSENNAMGLNNSLPWNMPADLQHFKRTTLGQCLLIGRKTHESIGRLLPDRTSIVLSSQKFDLPGGYAVSSIKEAETVATSLGFSEIYVAGGAQIYLETFDLLSTILLTRIHAIFPGDTFFPWQKVDQTWQLKGLITHPKDRENPHPYSFLRYDKS